jgi:hypothetical protein
METTLEYIKNQLIEGATSIPFSESAVALLPVAKPNTTIAYWRRKKSIPIYAFFEVPDRTVTKLRSTAKALSAKGVDMVYISMLISCSCNSMQSFLYQNNSLPDATMDKLQKAITDFIGLLQNVNADNLNPILPYLRADAFKHIKQLHTRRKLNHARNIGVTPDISGIILDVIKSILETYNTCKL